MAPVFQDGEACMPSDVKQLYRRLKVVEHAIGGDGGLIGMSGSLNGRAMSKVLEAMAVDSRSHFLDIGSGLGRPMLHALVEHGCVQVSGIEFDELKFSKAQTVIDRILPIDRQIRTCLYHRDVMTIESLDELDPTFTHLFSFWEGINIDAREAVARLVRRSWEDPSRPADAPRIRSFAFVQSNEIKPQEYVAELGFPPNYTLDQKFPVSMLGSFSQFQCFVLHFHDPVPSSHAIIAAAKLANKVAAVAAAAAAALAVDDIVLLKRIQAEQRENEFGLRGSRKRVKYGP
ncbi:hypothetical protein PYCC9005_001353 [Savitreella phatthalungensis]